MKVFQKIWIGLAMVGLLLTGCATSSSTSSSTNGASGQPSHAPAEAGLVELIRPGDLLTVTFSDLPPPGLADFKDRVKDDGSIMLHLGVKIQAAGKTAGQLQQTIEASYVPRYFRRVTISVKNEERFFFVGGEVRSPNRQFYASGITVLQAIDSAGGFTEFAYKKKVTLRRVNGQQYIINCVKALQDHTLDLPVYPGDSINVPKRAW